jgi:hypothetical protein
MRRPAGTRSISGAVLDARDSRGWTPFTSANGIS